MAKAKVVVEKRGIKEILEILKGLEILGKAGAAIAKDGKVDMGDITHLVAIAKDFDVLKEAVGGADEALKEMKDIDKIEAVAIVSAVLDLVKSLKA